MALQQTPQLTSTQPSAGDSAEAQIERLNELLMQPECPVVSKDATFSSSSRVDRRTDRRHPFLTEVLVVQLRKIPGDRAFRVLRGHSLNFSPNGIGFVLSEAVDDEQLLLLIDHPDFAFPNCYFSARPLRIEQLEDGSWEYGAILNPLFAFADASEFDHSLFELS